MIKLFWRDRSANFAIQASVLAVPLILGVGLAIDYSRDVAAHSHLQDLADAAALALAASDERNEEKLKRMAEDHVSANQDTQQLTQLDVVDVNTSGDEVEVRLHGRLPTKFMMLAGYTHLDLDARAAANRAVTGSIEVALVLDNTWSMSAKDAGGTSRIATLKKAAAALVEELFEKGEGAVRVGLVPYADYVNVGTANRNAPWLDVPDDYKVKAVPATCEKKMVSETPCIEYAAKYACTRYVDGVPEAATCGGQCTKTGPAQMVERDVCTGGVSAATYQWYGCVASRKKKDLRLTDAEPAERYPGFLGTSQRCLNPIVTLTDNKKKLLDAVEAMIINIGGYKPNTYIPAGLIWGQNVLSPTAPFSDGAGYHASNQKPRKVMVLMTDGDNTLRFDPSSGTHVAFSGNAAAAAAQFAQTNKDAAAICDYAKAQKVELFTVAFMVTNADAKALLEGCATDKAHYYDASDPEKLLKAFEGIGESLTQVRLVR